MKKKTKTEKQELITLEVSNVGPVVYGIGPGANQCRFQGQKLPVYLDRLWKKMLKLKLSLNYAWRRINKQEPSDVKNRAQIAKLLNSASWAYALSIELQPFVPFCLYGPTNPLRHIFLQRLEEIYTKCFAVAHLYGTPGESLVGLRGLITDFQVNGGIDQKTGGPGNGLVLSISDYYLAYFFATNREPVVYRKFAELMEAIGSLVAEDYPKAAKSLAEEINRLLESPRFGFGNKAIASDAKTAMLEKLAGLSSRLAAIEEKMPQKKQAVA